MLFWLILPKATPHNYVCGALRKFCARILLRFLAIHQVLPQKRAASGRKIFSQIAFAKLCGIALNHIRRTEKGRNYVDPNTGREDQGKGKPDRRRAGCSSGVYPAAYLGAQHDAARRNAARRGGERGRIQLRPDRCAVRHRARGQAAGSLLRAARLVRRDGAQGDHRLRARQGHVRHRRHQAQRHRRNRDPHTPKPISARPAWATPKSHLTAATA